MVSFQEYQHIPHIVIFGNNSTFPKRDQIKGQLIEQKPEGPVRVPLWNSVRNTMQSPNSIMAL